MQVAIIFHSSTGNVAALAGTAKDHLEALGHSVTVDALPELDDAEVTAQAHARALEHLTSAEAVLWGTPGRYGSMSGPLKHFIDQTLPLHQQEVLADKFMATFVSTASNHGGQESTILAFNNIFYHWGAIIVPAGAAGEAQQKPLNGNPYGVSSVSGAQQASVPEENHEAMRYLAERLVTIAAGRAR
ncbi:NAD(P)H-dependent oxidoreductase [Amycolatopsis sp. H6(2020)]|uniref:flavodoxin family protein n=1 Tax=Kocuria TaxID=57493 RepID=UPI00103E3B88|nr:MULTISPECIES: NAD(P)H-dependent oxidoreductase [Kocuria]MBE8527519.1 NAD(P)H-dependent oxidoreductase [Amycolatopsis sp. H6(2020)]MDT0120949.1 NAD(P)H-dependent oxidoreductase [Kocuria sp. PD6]QBJ21627.1 NAD(P)H dehydrogenase [Kocuria indica]